MNRLINATAAALSLSPAALARVLGSNPIPLRRLPNGALVPDLITIRRLLAEHAKPAFRNPQIKEIK